MLFNQNCHPLKLTPAPSQETTNVKQQYPWLMGSERSFPTPPVLRSKSKDLSQSSKPEPRLKTQNTQNSLPISVKTHAFQAKYTRAFDDDNFTNPRPTGYKDQKHDCAIRPASSGYL